MSIQDENIIDIIQVNEADKIVRLIATDHLPWGGDDNQHLYQIQEKVNSYLKYIESSQLISDYPHVEGFKTLIQIHGKYDRPELAVDFYGKMRNFLQKNGYDVQFVLKD